MAVLVLLVVAVVVALVLLAKGVRTVPQAHVAVVTQFGKFKRTLQPGLNLVNPFTNKVAMVIPVQNRTESLQFAAITEDQAAVHFTATIIFTVAGHEEETIKLVAFKFIDEASFSTALSSAVEASVREFVAGKKQAEVLGLRQSIVDHAKHTLDDQLASWGYLLVDLTVNDIAFDPEVMKSMSRVVSAKNAQTAAEFEGQALLIARTKQAEAEGKALVIAAHNGAEAARLRGEGIAAQRAAIADGLTQSGQRLAEAGLDVSVLAFSLWTEALRDIAANGSGNTIFLDGGLESMDSALRRTQGFIAASGPARDAGATRRPQQPAAPVPAASPSAVFVQGEAKQDMEQDRVSPVSLQDSLTDALQSGRDSVNEVRDATSGALSSVKAAAEAARRAASQA